MQYSEDDEYTRWCRAEGYRIAYCPDSVVMHSHNYTPRQSYKRSFGEAWALSAVCSPSEAKSGARALLLGWLRDALGDLRYCLTRGQLGQLAQAFGIRWQQRLGRRHGLRAGWQMHRVDHVL